MNHEPPAIGAKQRRGPPHDRRLYHVRAIVDGRVVLRHWGRRKQRWFYSVEWCFEWNISEEWNAERAAKDRALTPPDLPDDSEPPVL